MPVSLHIAQVVPYFYPAWAYGGIPRLAWGLSRALVARGHRVTVFTTDALDATRRAPPGRESLDGVEIHRFPNLSNHLAYQHQGFAPLGMAGALAARGRDFDVIHVHGHRHLPGLMAHRLARWTRTPLVLTPNGTLPNLERKARLKAAFDRLGGDALVADADALIAVSRAEINQMRRHGVPADRISLIPNGIDLAEFEALPPRGTFAAGAGLGGRRIVLYLGKLTPRKGVDHLLGAFALLGLPDVALVIAGNDMAGLLPGLKRRAAELGISDAVRFVGLIEGEQRLAALADADVLAYPSADEIFGLVPFEGLLAGAPAVVGDDCGCGELVAAANAGLLVRYGDVYALCAALKRLLEDPADRAARVARGRAYIARHFQWSRVGELTEAVYRRCLDARPRPRGPAGAP